MAKRLIWSKSASKEFLHIIEYWNTRNQSSAYTKKLRKKISEIFQLICESNYLGKPTSKPAVRRTICENYLIYYKILKNDVVIVAIFDGRRNPKHRPT